MRKEYRTLECARTALISIDFVAKHVKNKNSGDR